MTPHLQRGCAEGRSVIAVAERLVDPDSLAIQRRADLARADQRLPGLRLGTRLHSFDDVSKRSYEPLTEDHLRRLAELAAADRADLLRRKPHLRVLADRVLLVALCQGGALHWIDGMTGVKDLDVFTFYARHPDRTYPVVKDGRLQPVDARETPEGRRLHRASC